jgi:myo-inositol-1(or 4)-monophosphatase
MQSSDLNFQLAIAIDVARDAGRFLIDRFGSALDVRHKGEVDLVTEADEGAEALIVEKLRHYFPDDRIMAEEGTGGSAGDAARVWIVDPLDGTTNFAHAYAVFAVSIALEVDGEVAVGVVYAPALNELFTAAAGQGAFLNGKPIRVSSTRDLGQGLVCTGFPYDRDLVRAALPFFERVVVKAQGVRRDGAAAVDLCYTAMGRFDGFWEQGLQPWDVAAGSLILAEAGGRLTDYRGGSFAVRGAEIVATNGLIHEELVAVLMAPDEPGERDIVGR